jgi:hypothetical protein
MDVCVVCVLYSKIKGHSQDNQEKEVSTDKVQKKNLGGGMGVCVEFACFTVRSKDKSQDKLDKEIGIK